MRPDGRKVTSLQINKLERILATTTDAIVALDKQGDYGKGISPEDCSRLFKRFFQVKGQKNGGIGLGLYISKLLVEAHGGHLWVVSMVGAGNTFYLALPME